MLFPPSSPGRRGFSEGAAAVPASTDQETVMIRQIAVQEGNIVAFRLSGRLSHADYQAFLPRLEQLIAESGRLSILLELVDFRGWDLAAVRDDFDFAVTHPNAFERVAVVGHGSLQRWMTAMVKPFTSAGARFFEQDDLGDAWDWLREPQLEAARDEAEPSPYRRILVAVDFSPHSVRAVRRALALAGPHGSQVSLVHAVDSQLYFDQAYDPVIPSNLDDELLAAAEARMRHLLTELGAGDLSGNVLLGAPKGVILSQAEGLHADLIVMGTHGHRGISRLLGSAASAVMHSARCDVLTVRIDGSA